MQVIDSDTDDLCGTFFAGCQAAGPLHPDWSHMDTNNKESAMQLFRSLAVALALVAGASHVVAGPVIGQGTWETTLKARDINGNAVALDSASAAFFYDTTLNVTWLSDMNAGAGSAFDNGSSSTDGRMSWGNAMNWADSLTTGGFADWRLPTIIDSGALGCQFSVAGGTDCGYNVQTQVGSAYSEWAHLFYVTLGNLALFDTFGGVRAGSPGVDWGLTNTAYFQDMQPDGYWSNTEFALFPSAAAWDFRANLGSQNISGKDNGWLAVAVRSGDVLRDAGTVPEPQSLALVLTALAGMGLARRRRPAFAVQQAAISMPPSGCSEPDVKAVEGINSSTGRPVLIVLSSFPIRQAGRHNECQQTTRR